MNDLEVGKKVQLGKRKILAQFRFLNQQAKIPNKTIFQHAVLSKTKRNAENR